MFILLTQYSYWLINSCISVNFVFCNSESSSRCPVDNTPLTEADLFPDSCAEREILQLSVKCPNHGLGCRRTVDLMYIEHHTQACSFQVNLVCSACDL